MKKTLISNIILVAVSVLSLIFLAMPFWGEATGYNYISLVGDIGYVRDFVVVLIVLIPLFVLLVSLALLVFSIFTLLGDINVLKSEKLLNVSNKINFVLSIVICALTVLALLLILVKGGGLAIGSILLLLLAVAAVVAAVLQKKWSKE